MSRDSESRFDVLVIGGGPAGIAAALRAAECGVRVGIVDDNPALGGQIWRTGLGNAHGDDAKRKMWSSRLPPEVMAFYGTRVFDQAAAGKLLAEDADGVRELCYANLVLATGARERFLPFPGWTLPNVMGAGGWQARVKCGLPFRGKRVVAAGLPNHRRLCAGGRIPTNVGVANLLCRRAYRHWRRGVGTGRGRDRRVGCCRASGTSASAIWQATKNTALHDDLRSGIPIAARAKAPAVSGNDCMSLRRRFIFPPARTAILAGGEVAYALRNGPMPGKTLRTSHRISFRMEARLGASANFPSACSEHGMTEWAGL